MRLTLFLISLIAFTVTAPTAAAGTTAGVTLPDTVTVGDKRLTLNGMGLREATLFKIDVYVAGLYVEHVSSNPRSLVESDQAKQLVLRFVRDVGHNDIVKAWHEGFHNNATVPLDTLKPMIDRLDAWTPSFKKGDLLVFTYLPGQGVTVQVNNVTKGVINNADFARSLFAIWLGPKPPTGDVKRGLLGNHPGL
jgi:hypothetical protein